MSLKRGRWVLMEFFLAWMLMLGVVTVVERTASAQAAPAIATTLVSDTVYKADGTPASGTVLISWPAFTTASGASVPAGSTSATIGPAGALSVHLAPNVGATPIGSYYTVVYHLDDGSVTREYWVVPASLGTVAVRTIRSSVLPTSVAMQTVSKSYVDTAIAAAVSGHPLDSSPYVVKSGDTMTGALVLPADPTAALQASNKHYVDLQVSGVNSGLAQKVSLLPQATQTVAQPAGTELAVNQLNDVAYASQYVTGAGNNGIANATASPACASGCDVTAEHNYPSTEIAAPTQWNNQTHVEDLRGGTKIDSYFNPVSTQVAGQNVAETVNVASTQSADSVLAATGAHEIFSTGLSINSDALAGGSNVYPALIQGLVPYFKTTYGGLSITGTNRTLGQHVLFTESQDCYAVGDCLMGGMFMRASGGFRDDADEGSHPFDRTFTEDTRVFAGTCAQGCSPGATVLQVSATAGANTQGEGRFLIDTTPGKTIRSGNLIGGSPTGGRQPSASFTGTNFPVSVFLATVQAIPTQANSINPGTVTFPIATGGVPAGFATNTAALPAPSGVACVTDVATSDGRPLNYETAAYTVVDGSHLRMTLVRPHASGATVAVGGLCGYGLEQTVDTVNGIRQVFPVVGSTSPTSLLYAGGLSSIVGVQGLTSAYVNTSLVVASIARSNNVVTITTSSNFTADLNHLTLTVQGVADSSYNGSFAVTTTGPASLTYAQTGPDSTSSGGTISMLTGGFVLYPMAEVLGVYNASTKSVDGQLTLAANAVPWAAGDTVELPHYFQEWVSDDTDIVTQFMPRASRYQSAGLFYSGNNGPGLRGWSVENAVPATSYFGNGGTHTVPSMGMNILGVWQHSMEMEAGEDAAIAVRCNSHGCDKWNSGYDLFQMQTSAGRDGLHYVPGTSALSFNLRGTGYTFNPLGFTAGTINVTNLNAGTIRGLFAGTVAAESLPLFTSSGSGHQAGAVPDPGPAAGTTRFLREDSTWADPGGGLPGVTVSGTPSAGQVVTATSATTATWAAGTPGPAGPRGPAGADGVASVAGLAAIAAQQPAGTLVNLYNVGATTDNFCPSTIDGTLVAFGSRRASDFIPANAGAQMRTSNDLVSLGGYCGIAYYDANKGFVSGDDSAHAAGSILNIPVNAAFLRIATLDSGTPDLSATEMLVNGTVLPGSYQAFGTYPRNVIDAKVAAEGLSSLAGATAYAAQQPAATLVNLYNRDTLSLDHSVNTADGTLRAESGRRTSDFIPANSGGSMTTAVALYAIPGYTGIAYYDRNKVFLSGDDAPHPAGSSWTVPANAAFLRVSTQDGGAPDLSYFEMVVNGTVLPGTFQGFGTYPKNVIDAKLGDLGGKVAAAAINDVLSRLGYTSQPNLFDWRQPLAVGGINTADGTVTPGSPNSYRYTGYIPVGGATSFVTNFNTAGGCAGSGTAFYDINKVYLGGLSTCDGAYNLSYPMPTGTAFLRTILPTGSDYDLHHYYLGAGTTLPSPIPLYKSPTASSPWAGKTFGVFGDSYSSASTWQPSVAAFLGMTKVFQDARVARPIGPSGPGATNGNGIFECYSGSATGVNNKNVAHAQDAWGTCASANSGTAGNTLAQDIAGVDLMFVALGMNDFDDATLGSIADTAATASSYGYIRAAVEGLAAANPAMRIVWIEPPQASDTTVGTSGFTRAAYVPKIAKAIEEVCATYGVPVIRMWSESGINAFNASTQLDSLGIHPSASGWGSFWIPYVELQMLKINPFNWVQ